MIGVAVHVANVLFHVHQWTCRMKMSDRTAHHVPRLYAIFSTANYMFKTSSGSMSPHHSSPTSQDQPSPSLTDHSSTHHPYPL